jgi:hypothetical protein
MAESFVVLHFGIFRYFDPVGMKVYLKTVE